MVSVSLGPLAVLRVTAVLQDCVDQLAVLGPIIPRIHRDTVAADSEDARAALEQHRAAEIHLRAVRSGQDGTGGLSGAVKEFYRTQHELEHTLMDRTSSDDYLNKLQSDRRFAVRLITELMTELETEGTFHTLIHTVEEEKRTKAELQELITREEKDRLRIKTLQKQLLEIIEETTQQIEEQDKMVAHLEDRLQEWKMKKRLHDNYVKTSTELLVYQGQKINSHIEKQLEAEIETLKKKLMDEEKTQEMLEVFLKNNLTCLEDKLEYWMEHYDKDMEDKQQELSDVKTNRSNNLTQLQELANKYKDCEQVIIEDRMEKEKLRKQLEEEQLQIKEAIKIQSWWRGTMVRKSLGPFKKAKKQKQKKKGKK
ncbi:dynein regulatory complex protein 9 [Clarias gariepinus]